MIRLVMKRNFLVLSLFCFYLFTVLNCNGQSWIWGRSGTAPSSFNRAMASCTDPSGNVYIAGFFYSSTIKFGSITLTNNGLYDIYVVKYNSSGNVLWARSAGGTKDDECLGICSDPSGNVYITGYFVSPTITFGTISINNSGVNNNIFVTKYDPTGNVVWAKGIAASTTVDQANSMCSDPFGNVFICGKFFSPSITFGSNVLTNAGNVDVFIAKYDGNGNVLWAKRAGGSGGDDGNSVSCDASGNAFLVGQYKSSSIVFGPYNVTNPSPPLSNIFITKFDGLGNVYWANTSNSMGNPLGAVYSNVDKNGNCYIAGWLQVSAAFDTNTITATTNFDSFLVQYDTFGNALWAKSFIGVGYDQVLSVCSYPGGCFIAGMFSPTIVIGTTTLTAPAGTTDPLYFAQIDLSGNVIYTDVLKSGGDDWVLGIMSIDNTCNLYLTADYEVDPFIIAQDTMHLTGGVENVYVAKFNYAGCQSTGIDNLLNSDDMILVYPNPVYSEAYFKSDRILDRAVLQIYNLLGQCIITIPVNEREMHFDLPIEAGVYVLKICENDRVISNRKIIKE